MSISHLERLRKELEDNHWVVVEDNTEFSDAQELYWKISRPNGDYPFILIFTPGHGGKYGDVLIENIDSSISYKVKDHEEVEYLYFGSKYSGKFQSDVMKFVRDINCLK